MFAKNDRLLPSGDDIARVSVGTGPIAIGSLPNADGSILLTRTALETVGQFSMSFDLDQKMRQYFLDEGLSLDGYRTSGNYIFDKQQVIPEPIVIDSNGSINSNSILQTLWRDRISEAHHEPISINYLAGRWVLFLASSGIYGLDAAIPEEIIGLELSKADASLQTIHSIAKIDGHFMTGYKSIELNKSKIAFVSIDDSKTIHVVTYDMTDHVTKQRKYSTSSHQLLTRLLQHDRVAASGRQNSWVAEVTPKTYIIETMGSETL